MPFLNDLKRFYGTGEKNRAGQSLEEFLDAYDPKKYDCPSNTTDIAVARCKRKLERWGQPLELLLIRRGNHPSIGFWALPGGFVELKEDLEAGARRELEEETGVKGLPLQQLRTWGAYDRDPRWRVITTSFLALAEGELAVRAGDDAADALWMEVGLSKAESGDGREVWELDLKNQAHGISLYAKAAVTFDACGILPQERYELLDCRGLAVDHGLIIVQALLYLKERLDKRHV